jgi:hypothetical protein
MERPTVDAAAGEASPRAASVLLVDDDALIRDVVGAVLDEAG